MASTNGKRRYVSNYSYGQHEHPTLRPYFRLTPAHLVTATLCSRAAQGSQQWPSVDLDPSRCAIGGDAYLGDNCDGYRHRDADHDLAYGANCVRADMRARSSDTLHNQPHRQLIASASGRRHSRQRRR